MIEVERAQKRMRWAEQVLMLGVSMKQKISIHSEERKGRGKITSINTANYCIVLDLEGKGKGKVRSQ